MMSMPRHMLETLNEGAGSNYFSKLRGVVNGPRSMDLTVDGQSMQDGEAPNATPETTRKRLFGSWAKSV